MELLIKLAYVLGADNLLVVTRDAFIPRHSLAIDLLPDGYFQWWFYGGFIHI